MPKRAVEEEERVPENRLDVLPKKKLKKNATSEKINDAGIGESPLDDEFDDLEDKVQPENETIKYTDSDIYFDTINRRVLNFDMPLICSVSLATTNIHICLVCSKYLQGASLDSPANAHAIDTNHHIYINTQNSNFIILPEQLILSDARSRDLRDIQLLLKPEFNEKLISQLDTKPFQGKTLTGESYDVGFVPLINDYMSEIVDKRFESRESNSVLKHNTLYYALSHLPLIRDNLLRFEESEATPLISQLSRLTKKIWSPYLFKNFTSSFAIESYLVSCELPAKLLDDIRLFYTWLINTSIKENKKMYKDFFTGKLLIENATKPIKFINISVKLPQESVFKGSTSSSIEQYDLEKLIKEKGLKIIKSPQYLTIYIDRTNDMKIEGIEQQMNMGIVKFDPDSLRLNDKYSYKLVVNLTANKVQVLDKAKNRWVEFDGVSVKEVEKELLFISNCQLQIWELKR